MIDRATVQKIKQLLAEKVPHRQIAKRVGISRGTIGLMARDMSRRNEARYATDTQQNKDLAMLNRPFLRCPGCGGLCQLEATESVWRVSRERALRHIF